MTATETRRDDILITQGKIMKILAEIFNIVRKNRRDPSDPRLNSLRLECEREKQKLEQLKHSN